MVLYKICLATAIANTISLSAQKLDILVVFEFIQYELNEPLFIVSSGEMKE